MRVSAFLDIPGQDHLPPLKRLEKYAFSDNIFNRQIIARGLLDVFRDFSSNEDDFLTVMEIVVRLSEDAEPTVRTELMEQIAPIATFLQEHRADFLALLSEYLIPVVMRYLTDANNQVRKSSQEVLLLLLEQDLIFQHDIENKVCPILLDLTTADSDDEYKAEAVNIICKMASTLSKSAVARLLLPRFCELCGDSKLFQVRKVCATNFGDICHAVGQDATEKFLIPKFFELCADNVWGMRKACAECFMAVSYSTSPEVRRTQLSPLFIRLISDPCRWVRQAAFQSLGPFISTFANPARAGLYIREDGTLSIRPPAQDLDSSCPPVGSSAAPPSAGDLQMVLESLPEHMKQDPDIQAQVQVLSAALRAAQLDSAHASEGRDEGPASLSATPVLDAPAEARMVQSTEPDEELDGTGGPLQTKLRPDAKPSEENRSKLQDIIPQPLLDQYVSMTDPARAQTVDTDIAKHCAYSLPGVALTLGRQNWHCLKDTYETLASDVQWKVRRTLAFSIHELAVILGDQLTAADLVPVFNGFLKDLDEVRIGVLKHLYDFLKLLPADKRREYLYQLQEFVVTDNSRNWRFRYELAEQLILVLELYEASDVHDYLMQVALRLCADRVSEVRWISFKLAVAVLHKFYSSSERGLGLNFINELIVRFRHCPKWVGRQAFAFICQAVVSAEGIPVDQFVEHLLPSLLSLASDPVPNVRVLLAKTLRQTLLEKAYFRNAGNPHLEVVQETVLALQSDRDQDVSFFATLQPKRRNIVDTCTLENQNEPL
ncbi:serine/threonine-protein phosphatase 4 regulatory subunit 1-like [Echinops telfairi]|uniref:Serine/threonine-protein phosphatase 4 regulatory subunit 1-like n=1 Tax=Echinops telfairi TaxID=9371 RepID=A0AC55DM67_ECHTE|nr:serine/threonine-protein phosphatase 4 regulatory subunit 1-like [Echinops telfairi]